MFDTSEKAVIRTFLQFTCTRCKLKEFVEAEGEEPYTVDENWPIGWLRITSQAIGFSTPLFDTYCNQCKGGVLDALGYPSYKVYVSVVKAQADIDRDLETSPPDASDLEKEEVPFYLLDDDSN